MAFSFVVQRFVLSLCFLNPVNKTALKMHGPIWWLQHGSFQESWDVWKGTSTIFMYRKGEQSLGEGNTCQMSGSPCSKNNKFLFFWGKLHSLSREAATLTPGPHRGGRESNSPYKKRAAPILPLLFAMCCILELPWMQAGARHYQWLSGKLADNEFWSENRADIFQFSVWTKSREHFI